MRITRDGLIYLVKSLVDKYGDNKIGAIRYLRIFVGPDNLDNLVYPHIFLKDAKDLIEAECNDRAPPPPVPRLIETIDRVMNQNTNKE